MIGKKIIKALIAPVIVLAVHIIILQTEIYDIYKWLDSPMHFAGGLAVAITAYSLLSIAEEKKILKINNPLKFLFVISLVALIAVFWEFYEFLTEYFALGILQLGVADTMKDLFLGLVGASFGYLLCDKFA